MSIDVLPSSYTYGKVVCRIVHAVADTPEDEDALPQARPASGTVTFTPLENKRRVTDTDYPAFVLHENITVSLSSTGRIIDSEGRVGVWLYTGQWRVAFELEGGSVDAFDIDVTEAHTNENPLDLAAA